MTKAMLFDKVFSSNLYGSNSSLVYLTPLLGGYISDRYWGNKRSIIVGGIVMALGEFFFVVFFWSAFEQAGASLTFFAEEQTQRDLGLFYVPSSFFQSLNSLFIIILAPLFAWFWLKLGRKDPASPTKMAIELLW